MINSVKDLRMGSMVSIRSNKIFWVILNRQCDKEVFFPKLWIYSQFFVNLILGTEKKKHFCRSINFLVLNLFLNRRQKTNVIKNMRKICNIHLKYQWEGNFTTTTTKCHKISTPEHTFPLNGTKRKYFKHKINYCNNKMANLFI